MTRWLSTHFRTGLAAGAAALLALGLTAAGIFLFVSYVTLD